jgi:predicted enzyme related to lactoylglutathione lyase
MARVIGLGGLFFRGKDYAALREWYGKHLGISSGDEGMMFPWREKDNNREHFTVWSIFPEQTKYFGDPNKQFMMNFIVDDLDGMLDQLKSAGVQIDKREDHEYGRFAWIIDPEGNRVELWEAPKS